MLLYACCLDDEVRGLGTVYYRRGGEGEDVEVEVKAVRGILASFEEGGHPDEEV